MAAHFGKPTWLAWAAAGALLLVGCGAPAAAPSATGVPASSAPAQGSPKAKPAGSVATSGAAVPSAKSTAESAAPSPSVAGKPGLRKVRFGEVGVGLSLNVAVDQGFFSEQGIELERQRFDSAANMVAPLGAGQLDVGTGAIGAGLWNAVARGVSVKVVGDLGHTDASPPGFPQQELMVRKALYDSGKVKTPADLKGLTLGTGIKGTSTDYAVNKMLEKAGLKIADVEQVPMAPLELGVAMTNGKIDAAAFIQPGATRMLTEGVAVHLMYDFEAVPNNQALAVLYGSQFADSDLAVPFMTAFIKGARVYYDAVAKKDTAARNKIFDAAVKYGPEKDRTVYEKYTWFFAIDPNGKVNPQSLQDQQEFFLQTGQQTSRVDLSKIVDPRYAEQAAAKLGPHQ